MKKRAWVCPNCGNADRLYLKGNGMREDGPDLTVQCTAPVPPSAWSFDEAPTADFYNKDGTVPCGMQWDPNEAP